MGQSRGVRENEEVRRRRELQDFFRHLIVFIVVNGALFVIDLLESSDSFWFYWVTLFWGIGLLIQGFNALAVDQRLADGVLNRQREAARTQSPVGTPVRPAGRQESSISGELLEITRRATGLVDRMRTSARQIPDPEARREALSACAACDQVMAAVVDHPHEIAIARDFVDRFLEPASTVIGDYARLANRNVPSARETLQQVEVHDLPLITRRANVIYDRLHRGSLIDLEVAREMLTLDTNLAPVPKDPDRATRLDYGPVDSASS